MSKFKHEVRQSEIRTKETHKYSAEINGYDVICEKYDDESVLLSIYPQNYERLRIGIIQCRPRSVTDLEKFAEDAKGLLTEIAKELREALGEDLRSRHEIEHEKFMAQMKAEFAK